MGPPEKKEGDPAKRQKRDVAASLNDELLAELRRLQQQTPVSSNANPAISPPEPTSEHSHQPTLGDENITASLLASPEFIGLVEKFLNVGVPFDQVVNVIREGMQASRKELVILWIQSHLERAHHASLQATATAQYASLPPTMQQMAAARSIHANIHPPMYRSSSETGMPLVASELMALASPSGLPQGEIRKTIPPVADNRKIAASREPSRQGAHKSRLLSLPEDEATLSKYLCLVRKQIEFFAVEDRSDSTAQGRNKPIKPGQVGIRCIHCIASTARKTGSEYFPGQMAGIYPVVRKLAYVHLADRCPSIPQPIRAQLLDLKEDKTTSSGGRDYWIESARVAGVDEDEDGGLRFKA